MRVLVTGAGGFLGGAIMRRLADRPDIAAIAAARSDLRDKMAIDAALSKWKPDVVVHAAGRAYGSADQLHADNVEVTQRLAEAVGAASSLILLGSAAQYGQSASRIPWREGDLCEPIDAYGQSKLAAEAAASSAAERVTALRIFNVVAPEPHGDQAFFSFLRKARAEILQPAPQVVRMGSLSAIRDFVDVEDVLTAVERVIERSAWGATINVCTGLGRPVRALLEAAARLIDRRLTVDDAGAAPSPLDWSIGDPALCQARLGFTPASDLTALIRRAAAWVASAGREAANARPGA